MKVGQKVVCINDECGWLDGEKKLVKGEIYTVLWVSEKDVQVIHNDARWDKSRFRPIDTEWGEELLRKISKSELVCV
ncbi:hypothetical protein [Maribacter antarcticus]|uniref:hypothetical protein n=1 Tax=Maribacter antarcticus TaxID=505250 RepID=UPI00047EAD91|nr:hypothetical protein [Maribacter antarcticus]